MTLQYRAVLIDPKANQERPVQIFGTDRVLIDKWAGNVLAAAVSDDAAVNVYATEEQHVAMLVKPKPAVEVPPQTK